MDPKKMISFRLNQDVINKIKELSDKSGLSQAQILELAVIRLANHCSYDKQAQREYFRNMSTL